jgi:hypothetical protein
MFGNMFGFDQFDDDSIGGNVKTETPEMPEAYTQNRMRSMGMPAVAQIGEAFVDRMRAKKFLNDQEQGIEVTEVDEMQQQPTLMDTLGGGQEGWRKKGSGVADHPILKAFMGGF